MKKPTSNLDSGLTDKQTKFVAAYVTDCNATRAAIEAGYSERSARQLASRLLSNDDIRRPLESDSPRSASRQQRLRAYSRRRRMASCHRGSSS